MKLVTVKFLYPTNSKLYIFAAYEELTEGDLVVVDTVRGFQLAIVKAVDVPIPPDVKREEIKQVVSRVNTERYLKQFKKDVEARKAKEELKKRVEPIIEEFINAVMN